MFFGKWIFVVDYFYCINFIYIVEGFGFLICDFNIVSDFYCVLYEVLNCSGLVFIYVLIDVDEKVYLMVLLGVVNIDMIGGE